LLNIVTHGNQSHMEHRVVSAAGVILIACFMVAIVVDARARRRTG
jgi:hypothetical protein